MRHNQHIQLLHLIFGLRHMRHTDLNLCYLFLVRKESTGYVTVKHIDFEHFLVFHQQHSQHRRHLLFFESNHSLETKPTQSAIFLKSPYIQKNHSEYGQAFKSVNIGINGPDLRPNCPACYVWELSRCFVRQHSGYVCRMLFLRYQTVRSFYVLRLKLWQ